MKKLLGIILGVMTALGGFVDLGQIVFTTQAGALFGYQLMWVLALGTAAVTVQVPWSILLDKSRGIGYCMVDECAA